MGVGNSLGDFYDDEFHAAAEDWNSVTGKSAAISIKPVEEKPVEEELKPSIGAEPEGTSGEEPYNGHPFIDKLFGLNGQERYQTWPERAIRDMSKAFDVASKVSKGEVPMWEQDPITGEFHTSIEGMENARELMPLAMGGQIPLRIHFGQPSKVTTLKSLSQEGDEFAAMVRRYREEGFTPAQQAENNRSWQEFSGSYEQRIEEARGLSESLGHSGPNMPRLDSDAWRQFEADMQAMEGTLQQRTNEYHQRAIANGSYTVAEQTERNVQSFIQELESIVADARRTGEHWQPVGIREGESISDFARRSIHEGTEFEALGDSTPHQEHIDEIRSYLNQLQERERQAQTWKTKAIGADVIDEGKISLARIKSPFAEHETRHRFRFFDADTTSSGHMTISERNNGKQLYVEGIGLGDLINPQDIGYKGMKDMLYALKKEFPEAETVAGFRISGARGKANAKREAEMKLPKRPRN